MQKAEPVKARTGKPPVRAARGTKTPEKKTAGYRTFITGSLPRRLLRWTPAKTVVTFPYRAYCWASDVAEEYRAFAVSLDAPHERL